MGRKCEASDKPITKGIPCREYNAVVDDYDFFVNGEWVDGLEYIKNWNMTRQEELSKAADKFTANKKHYVERCRWLDGAEWADKTMIDKACEWLFERLPLYTAFNTGVNLEDKDRDAIIRDFRRSMED